MNMDIRTGFGYDIHRLVEGEYLLLGRIRIPATRMIDAHSDGDIVLHAVSQALYSAIGESDIGTHYPDIMEETRNMDSALLLRDALHRVEEQGFRLSNLVVTILLQEPKLQENKDRIKSSLSHLLGLPEERIAVHANTSERLNAVGEGKAIECYSLVTLIKEN